MYVQNGVFWRDSDMHEYALLCSEVVKSYNLHCIEIQKKNAV